MKIEEIKSIIKLMSENDLTEFKIESEEMTLCLRRSGREIVQVQQSPVYMPAPVAAAPIAPVAQPAAPAPAQAAPAAAASAEVSKDKIIESPTVGTFYRSSTPGGEPFVKVGSKVEPETTVAIVEAMKVMNEIKAEKSGVIKEILLENGQPVEFGQPIFILE